MCFLSNQSYDASSIQILEGLEAVRKRPGMYIGSTDSRGLHHLVWEILDNAIDEAINGYGKEIKVTLEKEQVICIEDFGRGVPVEKHASGTSAAQVIYTTLHAGGKFSENGGYKTAGGLHGVGGSVVNALSQWMEVTISRDSKQYQIVFENGGHVKSALNEIGKSTKTGTKVRFKYDESIFTNVNYSYTTISQRVMESAFLLEGIKFVLSDNRQEDQKQEVYCYEDGIRSFMDHVTKDQSTLGPVAILRGQAQNIETRVALQYTDDYQENTYSFVNLVRTKDGGTHEIGLKTAITRAVNDFARKYNLLKEKDKNFEGVDIREGLTAIIAVSIPESLLQFEGQTKSKLGSPAARSAVEGVVATQLTFFLEENHDFTLEIIKKIQKSAQVREAARKAREEARKGKKGKQIEKILSGKLAKAQTKDAKRNELFLVEGDSAGGSAKQGRDSKFQAILPLRGKVLNVERAKLEDVYKNEELNTLIHCIGAGVGPQFDANESDYDKVIIMTDADTDGAHIQVLLLTFFYRFMRSLIEAGKVYVAQPPLYRIYNKKESYYCYNEEQLQTYRQHLKQYEITRYKGLGEMNPDQLWDTTMNPQSRTLLQVSIDDAFKAGQMIQTLMGNQAHLRRDWIEENVDFDGKE